MSSGEDALDAADDQLSVGGMGDGGLFDTMDDFRAKVVAIIASWVVTNVFLEPAALILGFIDWMVAWATGGFETLVKTSVGGLAESFRLAIVGPTGVLTSIRSALVDVVMSAGVAAPLAVGLTNLALVVVAVGGLLLLGRVAAGYLSGGVLS